MCDSAMIGIKYKKVGQCNEREKKKIKMSDSVVFCEIVKGKTLRWSVS